MPQGLQESWEGTLGQGVGTRQGGLTLNSKRGGLDQTLGRNPSLTGQRGPGAGAYMIYPRGPSHLLWYQLMVPEREMGNGVAQHFGSGMGHFGFISLCCLSSSA